MAKPEKKQFYSHNNDFNPGPFVIASLYGSLFNKNTSKLNTGLVEMLIKTKKSIIVIQPGDIGEIAPVVKQLMEAGLSFFGFFPTIPGYSPPFQNCWKKINELQDMSGHSGSVLNPDPAISNQELLVTYFCFSKNINLPMIFGDSNPAEIEKLKTAAATTQLKKGQLTEFIEREETKLTNANIFVIYGNHCSGKSHLIKRMTDRGVVQINDVSEATGDSKYVIESYCCNNVSKSNMQIKAKKLKKTILFVEMNTPKIICRLLNYVAIEKNPQVPFYNLDDYELTYEHTEDRLMYNIKLDPTLIKIYF